MFAVSNSGREPGFGPDTSVLSSEPLVPFNEDSSFTARSPEPTLSFLLTPGRPSSGAGDSAPRSFTFLTVSAEQSSMGSGWITSRLLFGVNLTLSHRCPLTDLLTCGF